MNLSGIVSQFVLVTIEGGGDVRVFLFSHNNAAHLLKSLRPHMQKQSYGTCASSTLIEMTTKLLLKRGLSNCIPNTNVREICLNRGLPTHGIIRVLKLVDLINAEL